MFTKDFYLVEIKHYPQGEHSIAYIDANYEQRILDGNPMEFVDSVTFIENPEPFNVLGINCDFSLSINYYPTPVENVDPFNVDGICSLFVLTPDQYPYPIDWSESFDGSGVYSTFQILNGYCYSGFSHPVPFNPDGIYSPHTLSNKFHGYPYTFLANIPCPNNFPDWHRLNPPYLTEGLTIAARVNELQQTNTIAPTVKDRDEYRQEYSEYYKNYWRVKSQS